MSRRADRADLHRPAAPRAANGRRRGGPRIGSVAITPARVVILVALIGSLAYVAFALTVRNADQIPMLGTGAAILGVLFMVLAGMAFLGIRRAGIEQRDGRAVVLALLGGGSAIVGLVGIAMAIVLVQVWSG
jgi:hypothetical protein